MRLAPHAPFWRAMIIRTGTLTTKDDNAGVLIFAHTMGGNVGAIVANLMFELSSSVRSVQDERPGQDEPFGCTRTCPSGKAWVGRAGSDGHSDGCLHWVTGGRDGC